MQSRGERRQEILRRLNADEELLGMPKGKPDPDEEERQHELEDGKAGSVKWAMISSNLAGGF